MRPSLGRIVLYAISLEDSQQINRRRTNGGAIAERIKKNTETSSAWPLGAQAHIGDPTSGGDVRPMIITQVHPDDSVNGQVFLDGNDCFWATNIHQGPGPGTWIWPPRV